MAEKPILYETDEAMCEVLLAAFDDDDDDDETTTDKVTVEEEVPWDEETTNEVEVHPNEGSDDENGVDDNPDERIDAFVQNYTSERSDKEENEPVGCEESQGETTALLNGMEIEDEEVKEIEEIKEIEDEELVKKPVPKKKSKKSGSKKSKKRSKSPAQPKKAVILCPTPTLPARYVKVTCVVFDLKITKVEKLERRARNKRRKNQIPLEKLRTETSPFGWTKPVKKRTTRSDRVDV
jgi:hypothetical protein